MMKDSLFNLVQGRARLEIQKSKLVREWLELGTKIKSLAQQIYDLNKKIGVAGLEGEPKKFREEYKQHVVDVKKKKRKKTR